MVEQASRSSDPFAILGLPPTASADDVRAARRQLSKQLHPDALVSHNEIDRMAAAAQLAEVNRAVDLALAALQTRPEPPITRAAPKRDETPAVSFAIELLPVEAFELVYLAMSAIGDPKVVDEPYLLEGMVDDPALCACRIELAPEAGGTLVTVDVYPLGRSREPTPSALDVAGRLVAEIEALGRA